MTYQKNKEYQHITSIPAGMRIESNLEECIWHATGECEKSGLREFIKKPVYDGMACKCYAYIPKSKGDKAIE